jgi:hypothetical protein
MSLLSLPATLFAVSALAIAHPPAAAPAAAPAAPAVEPSAAAKDVARQLVPKSTWDVGVQQISAMVQARLEGHPGAQLKYPADLPQKIRAEIAAALPYDELVGMHARELTASFAEAELKEASAFFKTPAGKKWLEVGPKASEKVAIETQRRIEQKLPEIMSKMSNLAKTADGKDATKSAGEADAKKAAASPAK